MYHNVSMDQKRLLLALSRHAICDHLGIPFPRPKADDPLLKGEMYGSFVTLEIKGDLRGCIGYVEPVAPLGEQVRLCARSAAFQDPRFVPLGRNELDRVTIEVSLLLPPVDVTAFDEIEVGRDGLIVYNGGFHGLLLPQVAVDYGWDRDTFLSQTCWKAGLQKDAWKDPETIVQRFESIVFREEAE